MELIDRNKLIKQLNLLEKFNNEDVPQWVWGVINSQPTIQNIMIIPNNKEEK